jgi:predicted GNAT family acetyltransferase
MPEGQLNNSTKVTKSRFEIEQEGQISYLEFETDGHGWMTIWHTEVAKGLRGKGIGLELVTTAFQYAKENGLRVDVICPLANHLVQKHPEFQALLGKR